jgi:hypothetical protein
VSRAKDEFDAMKPGQRLGDTPVDAEYHSKMVAIVETLDDLFNGQKPRPPKKVGFVLLVFPYGTEDGRRCNFMSNGADRKAVTVLMKEMVARFEGQAETKGNG